MNNEVGLVTSIKDFLIHINGLPTVKVNDLVESENGARGWVNALFSDQVEILMLTENSVSIGQMFKRSGKRLTITVGEFLLGRATNPLGEPIDGSRLLAKTKTDAEYRINNPAPGIDKREFIRDQFDTGIAIVDSLIPLGKGQRELILADARSGKDDFLVDLIINQKSAGVICIYAMIGKPVAQIRTIIDTLGLNKALEYTAIIATSSTDPAPLIYLTPYAAITIAEHFQKQGKDVLVIFDDLGNHAKVYREISLLGNKFPGRESYPGDMFFQHANLLERAGKFKPEFGGGSITALPVIELNTGDFTNYIPTNLMSMTDGHLMFKSGFYNQGQRPAIDISLSVSRVGRQTFNHLQLELIRRVKKMLTQSAQLETVSRFATELPKETRLILKQKQAVMELVNQESLTRLSKQEQLVILSLVFTSFMDDQYIKLLKNIFVLDRKKVLLKAFTQNPELSSLVEAAFQFKNYDELLLKLESIIPKLEKIWQI
ncbi:F0F1 ATP synthase subunit alpha [Candidatus Daviesbacteria bacterium]|nr:F0F1 ATP synthase subunit alpha [Candidatus Daviesbacteria bacterium]